MAPTEQVIDYKEHDGTLNGEDYLHDLTAYVRQNGVPGRLVLHVDSRRNATLYDGNHRLRAAYEAGRPHVPLTIKRGSTGSMPGREYDGRFDSLPELEI